MGHDGRSDAGRRIGVYLCAQEDGAAAAPELEAVTGYALQLPGVCVARTVPVADGIDPDALAQQLRRDHLTDVIVAGTSPGFYKAAFAGALAEAGGDPGRVRLASFRAHGAGGGPADGRVARAKAIVACAVHDVPFGLAAEPDSSSVGADTLVIGAGVAGIQASLEIADAGHKVHLVERRPTIGGHMAMFDKTFPTLDCAACILTPKMVAVGKHPNIDLMIMSEVVEVSGEPGAYRVKVLRHATRVDPSACVACNDCAQFCPVTAPSEWDQGIATRKAIYIPFPQAVPNAYVVDGESCTWVQSGGKKCGACAKKCSKEAIHLDAKDQVVELTVGNIVVATGYKPFDPQPMGRYGYRTWPNVLTALEFERLTNASGPTGGKIVLRTKRQNKRTKADEWVFEPEGPKPRSVAIIHCVGSRDRNHNRYCSRVCCMYSLKFAHLVKEKLPGAECHEFFIDMRAYGKGYEEFLERIHEEGVHVVRGRSAEVVSRDGQLVVRGEDVLADRLVETPVDLVLLAVGLQPSAGTDALASMLGVARVADGWFEEAASDADPGATERGGIFIAGVCQGPKDIPDTVAQASGVAGRVLRTLVSGRGRRSRGALGLAEIERQAVALSQP
jgi:heterodisulfide reductase subunit A